MNRSDSVRRARSRSRAGCDDDKATTSSASQRPSRETKPKKNALHPDAQPECSHLPPPPYRPAGPFALYFAANWGSVGATEKERAMELLAVKWGCMTEEEKAPYYEKAKEVKETYFTKKTAFLTKRQELGIKVPISGYALFIADFAKKNQGNYPCATDLMCEGAKEWKKMPANDKDVWNKQSLEWSETYAKSMWDVCKKKVQQRYGKYDARINKMKPVDYVLPGHSPQPC